MKRLGYQGTAFAGLFHFLIFAVRDNNAILARNASTDDSNPPRLPKR
jgi:hypothetical protein